MGYIVTGITQGYGWLEGFLGSYNIGIREETRKGVNSRGLRMKRRKSIEEGMNARSTEAYKSRWINNM